MATPSAGSISIRTIQPCVAVRWRGWCPGTSRGHGTTHCGTSADASRPTPGRHTSMEMEDKDPSKRGRWIVVIGVVLALAAGGAAFFLINQAQQQAGQGTLQKVAVVVATRVIPARKPLEADDVTVREIPLDPTNAQGIVSTPDKLIGRVLAVTVLQDQMVTTNMLASEVTGGQFSIL